jgi:hypothetical protein
MNHAKAIGRLSILAVGLGIGAALAYAPGVAAADPVSPLDPNVAAASVDGVTGTLGTAATDPAALPVLDIAISFSGITLLQEGSATATSGIGDLAIALGAGSDADANFGIFDTAFADGTGSDAFATAGSLDTASAVGTGSVATAGFGNGDVASVFNTGSALDSAGAGGAAGNLGSNDIAFILGTGSTADAGADVSAPGNFDLAAVFGDMLHATMATGGNFLVDIVP